MNPRSVCVSALGLAVIFASVPSGAIDPAKDKAAAWTTRVERLSFSLRGRRLSSDERAQIERRLAAGELGSQVYSGQLDAWFDRDFFRLFLRPSVPARARGLFAGRLVKHVDLETHDVTYALPDAPEGEPSIASLCKRADRKRVKPWWSTGSAISVCSSSYRPDVVFDAVGFCGGQPEPSVPTPLRKGCGCGPLLIACLPPAEDSDVEQRLDVELSAEYIETASDILDRHRAWDEVLTTSRTWQTGPVRFLYARREMLADLSKKPFDAAFEARWISALKKVDVLGEGKWIDRTGIYSGAGVFLSTPAAQAAFPTYRVQMKEILQDFLDVWIKGVNVDRDNLLAAVTGQHADLRSLRVHESPMRTQTGCSTCHAPMDYGAAFLVGLRTPLFGAFPSGEQAEGKLYVGGASDLRGTGKSLAELGKLVVGQPEFEKATLNRTYQLLGFFPAADAFDAEKASFHTSHDLALVLRRAFLMSEFFDPKVR